MSMSTIDQLKQIAADYRYKAKSIYEAAEHAERIEDVERDRRIGDRYATAALRIEDAVLILRGN